MTEHHSGFIAIIGRANVGKSTLLNALLGQKVAAVSPRPQTTRKRQLGILTIENAQLVFVDTPGFHHARHKLGEFLNYEAEEAADGVDIIMWLVDSSDQPTEDDIRIADLLNKLPLRAQRGCEQCDQYDSRDPHAHLTQVAWIQVSILMPRSRQESIM